MKPDGSLDVHVQADITALFSCSEALLAKSSSPSATGASEQAEALLHIVELPLELVLLLATGGPSSLLG